MRAIKSLAYISEDYNPLDFGGIWLCEDYTVPLHSAAFAFLWMRSVAVDQSVKRSANDPRNPSWALLFFFLCVFVLFVEFAPLSKQTPTTSSAPPLARTFDVCRKIEHTLERLRQRPSACGFLRNSARALKDSFVASGSLRFLERCIF